MSVKLWRSQPTPKRIPTTFIGGSADKQLITESLSVDRQLK